MKGSEAFNSIPVPANDNVPLEFQKAEERQRQQGAKLLLREICDEAVKTGASRNLIYDILSMAEAGVSPSFPENSKEAHVYASLRMLLMELEFPEKNADRISKSIATLKGIS